MLSERLKSETQQQHIAVEKLIIPKIKALDSNESYAKLLNIFYGYFKPLEEKVNAFISTEVIADIDERRKVATIESDLDFIGQNSSNKIESVNLPSINTIEEALGAMYVMEGSTLGGVHLTKMIAAKMHFENKEGLQFFNGYGDLTMEKWDAFKATINLLVTTTTAEDKVVIAANETFVKFKDWIEKN